MNNKQFAYSLLLAGVGALALIGCGGSAASNDNPQLRGAMKVLGLQYGAYLGAHNGTPPKDEASLREFLTSRMGELEGYNVKKVDDLFPTGRDGKPLKVIYGATVTNPDVPSMTWAAYEESGADGKRFASDARGSLLELSDADFAKQVPLK